MNCKHRSAEKELLDGDNIPFEDIKTNMEELNTINKWLGGHFITCKGVAWFLNKAPQGTTAGDCRNRLRRRR